MNNKKKKYSIIDKEIRDILIKAVSEGIRICKEKESSAKPFEGIIEKQLEIILKKHKTEKIIIQGLGTKTFEILIHRLKDVNNIEETIEDELKLIEEREKEHKTTFKQVIYQAGSIPPKEPFQLSDDVLIRPPTDEEKNRYDEMPDMSRYIRGYHRGLTIIEWTFTVDLSKHPKVAVLIGENQEEKLTNIPMNTGDKVLNEIVGNQYGLFRSCFLIGGNGDFMPIYVLEKDVNPYTLGSQPKPIDVQYLDLFRRTGINFNNLENQERIKILYLKLKKHLQREVGPIIVATKRLFTFYSPYKNDVDKYIDGAIILEALLMPELCNELSFRLSLYTSLLLGESEGERNRVFKIVRAGYNIRSKLVHGESKDIKIKEATIRNFSDVCIRTYLKCLDLYDYDNYKESIETNHRKLIKRTIKIIESLSFKDTPYSLEEALGCSLTTYEEYKQFLHPYT